jgi:hypothetical protein
MISVGEVDIKERISLSRQEYSVLKENMKGPFGTAQLHL